MRVLLIAQYFPPDIGGAATRAINLAKGLSLNACNVTVIAAFPHYPSGRIPDEYKWVPIKMEWMGNIKVVRTLMPPLRSKGFINRLLLMGFFAVSALFAWPWIGKTESVWAQSWIPGLIYGKLKRAPVALNVDDLTLEDLSGLRLLEETSIMSKIGASLYRTFYVKGDVVTPISPGYVETIVRKYRVDLERIRVVGIGVDLTVFRKNQMRRTDGSFRVMYAGILGLGYDFEQVFRAAKILEERESLIEFILHGNGECLEVIRSRISELGLTNLRLSDRILGSKREVADLLNEADVLILPLKVYSYPYLGIPSKLYEYQAVGKPVICCAEGEPAKYIRESKSGVVVEPGDSEALVEAILFLYRDNKTARDLGEAGREHVMKNSSLERTGLEFVAAIDGIMHSCQRR